MKRQLIPIGLILLVAILFAPLCRPFVREILIIPFLYIFWIGKFFIDTVPQVVIWIFFVITLFLILALSFIERGPSPRRRVLPTQSPQSRVGDWLILIERAREDDYFKWRLGQQLQRLALRRLAHESSQSVRDTRNQLRKGAIDMPSEITAYFQASLQPLGYLSTPALWQFWKKRAPSPLDLDPIAVAEFLERLDIENPLHGEESSAK